MGYKEEISGYIRKKYNVDNLQDDTSLFASGIIDSFGILELVAYLEQKYSLRLESKDLIKENLETVIAISRLVGANKQ